MKPTEAARNADRHEEFPDRAVPDAVADHSADAGNGLFTAQVATGLFNPLRRHLRGHRLVVITQTNRV